MSNPTKPFGTDPDLQKRVDTAATSWNDDKSKKLLQDISKHVDRLNAQIADLSTRLQQLPHNGDDSLEPPSKKRKLPLAGSASTNGAATGIQAPLLASIKDVSFSIPVRKKYTLEIYGSREDVKGGVKVVNTSNGVVETELTFAEVEQVTVTPLPERASLTYSYCILPKAENPLNPPTGISFSALPTVPPSSSLNILNPTISSNLTGYANFAPLLNDLFNMALRPHNKRVIDPNPDDFVSNIVQAHRKNEKSWCTKAWKGSKEGHLYPLSPGLLFGFKKPILFFPFRSVESVSYTNVLQRTFNLVVTVMNADGHTEDVEFSMLDQADFAPVDEWVKKHGLDDQSLAKDRRAKVYGVNKTKAEREDDAANGEQQDGDDDDDATDLAKAERELQDAEDEEEEDFDPGSEGDSDGSGSDSDGEEDAEGHDEEVEEVEGKDDVKEEDSE